MKSIGKWTSLERTILSYQGDWAWVHTWNGKDGWIRRSEVVPLDGAVLYFTRMIATEPTQPEWYQRPAVAWEELGDLEEAVAGYYLSHPPRAHRSVVLQ